MAARLRRASAVTPAGASSKAKPRLPRLGLVCVTACDEVRYRTITRIRFLSLPEAEQRAKLDELYRSNLRTLFKAVDYCRDHAIGLYRATSALFPQVDHPVGKGVLASLRAEMAGFGAHAAGNGVRVVLHPDQYVVLSSDSLAVREQSLAIMADHALAFDMLGLPRTAWSCMTLHGGKGGRADMLVHVIRALPEGIRGRLVLENDESAYGAAEILDVCRRAGVPMVFDAHHHVVREKLDGYGHASVGQFVEAARGTWPDPAWQVVHISNGAGGRGDPRHSDLITDFPPAFRAVPWVEVEAKAKERAIEGLVGRLGSR